MSAIPIKPRCVKCGYDLAGLRVDDRCPECGEWVWSSAPSIADPIAKRAASALAWGRVAICASLAPFMAFFLAIGWFITIPACVVVAMISGISAVVMSRRCRRQQRELGMQCTAAARDVQSAERLGVYGILTIALAVAVFVLFMR